MKLKYLAIISFAIIATDAPQKQNIGTYVFQLNEKLQQILQEYITTDMEKPIQPFINLSNDLLSIPQKFNAFKILLSREQGQMLEFMNSRFKDIDPKIISLLISMHKIYSQYFVKEGDSFDNSALYNQATLFFIHLFINTQIIPFLYQQKSFRFNDQGFITLETNAIKKMDNLSRFRNNLPILMKEILNEDSNGNHIQLLKQKLAVVNYIFYAIKPYLKEEMIYKIENPLNMFQIYLNNEFINRHLSKSLLNEIDNKSREFGVKQVLEWSNPKTIQDILSNIRTDYSNIKPTTQPVSVPAEIEPTTWAGYLKKLF